MSSRKEQADFSRQKDTSSPGANHDPWNTEAGAKYLETGLKAGIFNPVRDEHIGGMSFLKGFEITNIAEDSSKSICPQETSNASETSSQPKSNDDIAALTNLELLTNKQLTNGWDGATPSQGDVIRRFGNSQVGFWGDDHSDPKSVEHLNEGLATLKNAGVSTIAIEGLDRNGQNLARSWLAAPNGSKTANELESKIRSYLKQAQPDGDRPSAETVKTNQLWRDKTFDLLQGLKTAGLHVLGLEPDITSKSFDAEQDKNWHGNVKTFLAEHPGEKLLIFSGALHFTSTNHSFKDRMSAEHINVVDLTPPSQYKQLEPQ